MVGSQDEWFNKSHHGINAHLRPSSSRVGATAPDNLPKFRANMLRVILKALVARRMLRPMRSSALQKSRGRAAA